MSKQRRNLWILKPPLSKFLALKKVGKTSTSQTYSITNEKKRNEQHAQLFKPYSYISLTVNFIKAKLKQTIRETENKRTDNFQNKLYEQNIFCSLFLFHKW